MFSNSASCTGIIPSAGADWNITSNTTCSDGDIGLSENRTIFIPDDRILELNNITFEPSGPLDTYISVDSSGVLSLDENSTLYLNDEITSLVNESTDYTYDANGNMLNDSLWFYTYNEDNRLVTVTDQAGGLKEQYVYDHGGGQRKVKLTILDVTLNKTTYYLSQSWMRDEYTNGTTRDIHYIHANNELLARKDSDLGTFFYHPDHLGSTSLVMQTEGTYIYCEGMCSHGDLAIINLERIMYLPYGSPRQSSEEMF